jgi:hypothetical protein
LPPIPQSGAFALWRGAMASKQTHVKLEYEVLLKEWVSLHKSVRAKDWLDLQKATLFRQESNDKRRPLSFICDIANAKHKVFADALLSKDKKKLVNRNRWLVTNLRKVLDEILATGRVNPSKAMKYFLKTLPPVTPPDEPIKIKRFVKEDGQIWQEEVIRSKYNKGFRTMKAKEILEEMVSALNGAYPGSLEKFSFDLIESLNRADLRRLRKCERCGDYFEAYRADGRIKFCPVCSPKSKMTKKQNRKYQKNYRARQKAARDAEHMEKTIASYMENLDCSEKEAEELYKDEFPEIWKRVLEKKLERKKTTKS